MTVRDNSIGSPGVGGTLSPSRITDLDVTDAPALSGGGLPSVPSRILVVLVEEAKAGGTPRPECPRDDQGIRSLAGVAKPAGVTVYDDGIRSPCVGGRRPLPLLPGGSFRLMLRMYQSCLVGGLGRFPHGFRWCWSMEVRVSTCDVTTDGNIMSGLDSWNTEGDILDQYETFNGMPVYYGGDLYDSEDSDWDDPYAIASAAYVEDYNFDVLEGIDLMVHRQRRDPCNSDIQQDRQMDMTPLWQTMSCDTRDEGYVR